MPSIPNRPATPGDDPDADGNSPETTPLLRAARSASPTPSRASTLSSLHSSSNNSTTSSTTSPRRTLAQKTQLIRSTSLFAALLSSLCAGSITIFSLYGHIFQARLRYTQFEVNGLASAASVAMYAPVPLLGYLCDRAGPAPLSVLAAGMFGAGYAGAAAAYGRAAAAVAAGGGAGDWYGLMVLAFVAIGVGTCAMYMGAVATCAKNFGRGKHRGLAVALPIAAFGLSGMWMSQLGSHLFLNRDPSAEDGEVDVVKLFVFLAVLLVVVGVIGAFGLRIVDEKDLIEEAVEELERSGILDGSVMFTPGRVEGYGAVERGNPFDELEDVKDPAEEEARLKKQWVLNAETRRFLTDHTMWCFALGFFLMIGPGEAFINNMGTVIKTLYPPTLHYEGKPTSAATHVSIVGITSTAVRLLTGTLTDLLAPSPKAQHVQITTTPRGGLLSARGFSISRVSFLLFFAALLSLGLAGLASGIVQNHGDRFWVVSGLVGAGYGAVFSLTPIIITVIWGVENFATNWGIVAMFPALGATFWGLVYSAVYQGAADRAAPSPGGGGGEQDNLCYGEECYAPAFWAMAASVWVACGLVLWAWKGRNGWAQRGIVV
ncbi:major facilitator superfamily domain-containing protein [Chaetomium fimeti]|uniref:Probable transporter MCH1 n=1 Tax=Chaetomium fimeti TaxID=1854472 RepID=A0AAE0HBK5_9PEZI|nr:major facilitator superfamily domain-containing protein [Chaetomium fimeti]